MQANTNAMMACCALGAAVMMSGPAMGDVIISELMYNPNSSESPGNPVEWIEIYNTGSTSVDLTGWSIQDEDASSDAIASGMISPGEAAVIYLGDSVAEFQAAWGTGFQVFTVGNDVILSNSPTGTNEILELVDAADTTVDTVNYDDESPWPSDNNESSIYLLPGFFTALDNDTGANWGLTTPGVNGENVNDQTSIFNGSDIGTPGFAEVPAPGVLALLGVAGVAGSRRRRRA